MSVFNTPDLRAAILDGSFQREPCPKCNVEFRLDPKMTYVDVERGQWIAVYPSNRLDHWNLFEDRARATFARAYGAKASAAARALGADLKARLVFGWAALREKLLVARHGLDDVILELAKAAMIRSLDNPPVAAGTELRLVGVQVGWLAVAWLDSASEEVKEVLRVPRSVYDEIAADTASWSALYASVSAGPFVDVSRFLVAEASAA
jgi:hypothetical protein